MREGLKGGKRNRRYRPDRRTGDQRMCLRVTLAGIKRIEGIKNIGVIRTRHKTTI
jgi:hypothetical protein